MSSEFDTLHPLPSFHRRNKPLNSSKCYNEPPCSTWVKPCSLGLCITQSHV